MTSKQLLQVIQGIRDEANARDYPVLSAIYEMLDAAETFCKTVHGIHPDADEWQRIAVAAMMRPYAKYYKVEMEG